MNASSCLDRVGLMGHFCKPVANGLWQGLPRRRATDEADRSAVAQPYMETMNAAATSPAANLRKNRSLQTGLIRPCR